MSIRAEHEIHTRRKGRNMGVGLLLGGFVVLVMVLTFVKITQIDFAQAPGTVGAAAGTEASE